MFIHLCHLVAIVCDTVLCNVFSHLYLASEYRLKPNVMFIAMHLYLYETV